MMMPMVADATTRTALGLAALLLLTPWRVVPPAFFRTHCQIILGLLVVAAIDWSSAPSVAGRVGLVATIGAATLAVFASVAWGLGLPRLGVPATALIVAMAGTRMVAPGLHELRPGLWIFNAIGNLASAFLIGSALTAMLLGHHYLTAPAMSIDPLRRFVRCMAWGLGFRALLAAVGLWIWSARRPGSFGGLDVPPLFLAARWGMGIAAPALATYLAWKTVQIRSTQSATGILYIATTLVLFGELTALILARPVGIIF